MDAVERRADHDVLVVHGRCVDPCESEFVRGALTRRRAVSDADVRGARQVVTRAAQGCGPETPMAELGVDAVWDRVQEALAGR